MSQQKTHNLRSGEKLIAEIEEFEVEVARAVVENEKETVVNEKGLVNVVNEHEAINSMCEKFGEKLHFEFNKIVESLKSDLAHKLKSRDLRIASLEDEILDLRNSLAVSNNKIVTKFATLESNIETIVDEIDRFSAKAPPKKLWTS